MIGKKLIASKPVSLPVVKDALKERSEESALGYEQILAFEYAKKHAKISKTKAEKLSEELKAFEELNEEIIIKIIDLCPTDANKLRLLLPKTTKLKDEQLEEIAKLVKKALE